ncbi:hypothetical protein F2P45_10140 [Massilia sp. CCM 8733]|uniref:Anti-sigma factor n=1 Tax=Massilia mucilaginosa TaxID=2609282 RepID=A0ABX0NRD6_9BURK|nr:hypothetical protein [Massilia mucilaginosa]NHZ89371.1 hypothetical protein [Massilia mucilaginosa]
MSFSDEILKAYADGALGEDTRQAVEAALREDPLLAARVRLLLTQHSNAFAGFGPGSADGAAQRQAQAPRSAKVVHLHAVRNARVAGVAAPAVEDVPQIWSWPAWAKLGAMLSAAVLAGAGLGYAVQPVPLVLGDGDGDGAAMMARGALAQALTQQLSGTPAADAPVRIGASFLSREGGYCRSFRVANGGGLACRIDGGGWQLDVFAGMDGAPGEYRSPGDGMPQAVSGAIARRADEPLDPIAERAARDRGWKR